VRVREAARLIQEAARPVIVAGGGARHSGAGVELRELAERIGCPVATSVAAYSLVPEDHPLYIGVPGTYSRSCANKALQRADLVLYVGSRTGSQVTHFWQVPRPGTAVIQVGVDPGDLGRNYPNAVPLLGDARVTLRALIEALPRTDGNGAWLTEVQGLAADWRGEAAPLRNSDAVPMRPERILKELGGALPEDVLLVCDTGHSAMWAAQHLWMNSVKWDFIRCAGSLGWAFPAALGVKCARPERPVVCFTGDGGFWYHIQEVETAVRCGINTVTVVNNNHSLNQETSVFVNAYSGNPSGKQGEMWHFSKQSLARVAESMGAAGFRAEAPGEIRPAVEKALACGRPAVVEVMSDIEALAPVAWTG
jgi:acetolactate synthase-1/2/3 large subunit